MCAGTAADSVGRFDRRKVVQEAEPEDAPDLAHPVLLRRGESMVLAVGGEHQGAGLARALAGFLRRRQRLRPDRGLFRRAPDIRDRPVGLLFSRRRVHRARGGADRDLALVHRRDDVGSTALDDGFRQSVRVAAVEARLLGSDVPCFFASPNLWTTVHKLRLIRALALPAADLGPDRLRDGDPFGWREVLAHLVLGVLTGDDARHIDDPHRDGAPSQDPCSPQAALAKHQGEVSGHADRLQQADLVHAVGEHLQVAHVVAMPMADADSRRARDPEW